MERSSLPAKVMLDILESPWLEAVCFVARYRSNSAFCRATCADGVRTSLTIGALTLKGINGLAPAGETGASERGR